MFSNLSSCVHSMRGLLVALVIAISSSACSTEAKKARHLKRGEEYLAEGKQREAIIEFLNVIQLDENDRVATQRLAVTLYKTGQLGPAFRYLQRAAEFDPRQGSRSQSYRTCLPSYARTNSGRRGRRARD